MSSRAEVVGALAALIRRIDSADTIDDVRGGTVLRNARDVLAEARKGIVRPVAWTTFERISSGGRVTTKQIADTMHAHGMDEAAARALFDRIAAEEELWMNSRYQVNLRRHTPTAIHLSIKRIDQEAIHDWRDLQRIKDELVGPECEAVELYPAQSRLADSANQYHLWAVANPEFRFPLGFNERLVDTGTEPASHGQRPMEDAGA